MRVKLKRMKKNKKVRKDWNILRREEEVGVQYAVEVSNKYGILWDEAEDEGVERCWRVLQDALVSAAEEIIPKEKRRGRKAWMTDEILDLMEKRRKVKNVSEERYRELDRNIRQMCKEKKEQWLGEMCEEVELLKNVDSRLMTEKIREITGKRRTARSTIVKDKNGNILTERKEVLKRWEEYVGELYGDTRGERPELGEIEQGPSILRCEVEKAVRGMKWRKAGGVME